LENGENCFHGDEIMNKTAPEAMGWDNRRFG
jgi:hypothetical protein